MILYAMLAILLCAGVISAIAPKSASGQPIHWVGFNGQSVILIFVVYVAAHTFLGGAFAISLLAALALHETGHVLAHHMLGRGASHFRLAPVLSDVAVQSQPFRDEGQAFFVALMGAGFSLGPLVLAVGLGMAMQEISPDLSAFLLLFSATVAGVNCLLLLPFRGLDGGRCAEISARNFWPALVPGMSAFMIAAFAVSGLRRMSIAMLLLAGYGVLSLFARPVAALKPMGPDAGLTALAAYVLTFAAHFSGAILLVTYL